MKKPKPTGIRETQPTHSSPPPIHPGIKLGIYGLYMIGTAVIGAVLGTAAGGLTGCSGAFFQNHSYFWNDSLNPFTTLVTMTMIGGAPTGALLGLGMSLWLAYRHLANQQKKVPETTEEKEKGDKIKTLQKFMAACIIIPAFTFGLPLLTSTSLTSALHGEDYLFANFDLNIYLELLKVNAVTSGLVVGGLLLWATWSWISQCGNSNIPKDLADSPSTTEPWVILPPSSSRSTATNPNRVTTPHSTTQAKPRSTSSDNNLTIEEAANSGQKLTSS